MMIIMIIIIIIITIIKNQSYALSFGENELFR